MWFGLVWFGGEVESLLLVAAKGGEKKLLVFAHFSAHFGGMC